MKETIGKLFRRTLCGLFLVCAVSAFPAVQASANDMVIVLDPGHGGNEAGAYRQWNGVDYREELLTLKIAQYAKEELEKYAGVDVYLTRTSNNGPAMDRQTRILYAKSVDAAALVSIHLNSTGEDVTNATGAWAYVPSSVNYPNSNKYAKRARKLGTAILESLNAQTGLRNNGFGYDDELGIILFGMQYRIPSLIIEHCFINNPDDCLRHLSTEASLRAMGAADAAGIAKACNLSKAPAVTGWKNEDGKRCYYVNGRKVKNAWQVIDGKNYYFDSTGALQTGIFKIGKDAYLSSISGVQQSGLVKYNGRLYLASNKGRLYAGWRDIDGKRYYFSPKTYGAYGGFKTIGSNQYYFSRTTFAMKVGWVGKKYGAKRAFNPTDGRMLKNRWVKYKKRRFYLGPDGIAYYNTTKVINGKEYEFDEIGVCTNY